MIKNIRATEIKFNSIQFFPKSENHTTSTKESKKKEQHKTQQTKNKNKKEKFQRRITFHLYSVENFVVASCFFINFFRNNVSL